MTDTYAHWAFLAEEGDDALTLVDNAREESRLYPRPMLAASLSSKPLLWNAEQIRGKLGKPCRSRARIPTLKHARRATVSDISIRPITCPMPRAKALAEWYSVERYMNV